MAKRDGTRTDIDALTTDPHNRRKHPDRNVTMIADALREVGPGRSIVIDEDDVVLAGNGVIAAARQAGVTAVRIIDTDGDELIAVRRRNLTDDQKRALAIYDNRTAELAEWNAEQLRLDDADGLVLRPFFSDEDLARIGIGGEVVDNALGEWRKREMPEFQNDAKAFRSLMFHFATKEDLDHFLVVIGGSITDKTKYVWYSRPVPKDPA